VLLSPEGDGEIGTPKSMGRANMGISGAAKKNVVTTLFARHEHGGFPVHVVKPPRKPASFHLERPNDQGGTLVLPSGRQLLRALYNNGNTTPGVARDPGMSLDRYFRVGKWARKKDTGLTVFDLFGKGDTPEPKPIPRNVLKEAPPPTRRCPDRAGRWYKPTPAITTLTLFGSTDKAPRAKRPQPVANPSLSVEPPVAFKKAAAALSVDPAAISSPLGIDLVNRSHEVKKLLYAGFGARMARKGYDPEEVLQEVYKGLLTRNMGTCQFDPSKSSFGHYVYMVCGCILNNYQRKEDRRRSHEQTGMYIAGHYDDGEPSGQADAALAALDPGWQGSQTRTKTEAAMDEEQALKSLQARVRKEGRGRPEGPIAVKALPLLYRGHTRSEIASKLGHEPSRVGRALAFIRKVARNWADEGGISLN